MGIVAPQLVEQQLDGPDQVVDPSCLEISPR
jgi:hypothetical protein